MSEAADRNDKKKRELASAIRRREILVRQESFDPFVPDSRPTAKQAQVFQDFGRVKQQWIRAGNQTGKTATCARIVTWVLTGTHPYWTRPEAWGDEPLLVLVAGRTGKQIEESLWPKIRSYLEPGTYKEVRLGNILQRVELAGGNRIVFQSLENPTTAQQRLQSYVAHLTWVDELPPTMGIVRELLIRVQARDGYFLASFTPTIVQVEIQKYVDNIVEPEGKVYRFHMLDNPLYSSPKRRAELLSRYAHLTESIQKAIFEGEWLQADGQVYYFSYDTMVRAPEGYSPSWRHLEIVDPATQSKLGLAVLAEDPDSGQWYLVRDDYISDIFVPTEIVREVQKRTSGVHIVRRICDPEGTWYINQAGAPPFSTSYMGVYSKNTRKKELIAGLQESLGGKLLIAPWCQNAIDEIQSCRWSETTPGKIVNGSKYHILDCLQYGVDNLPKPEVRLSFPSQQEYLYRENEKRKQGNEKARMTVLRRAIRRGRGRGHNSNTTTN